MKKPLKRAAVVAVVIYFGILAMLMLVERFLVYPAPPKNEGVWAAETFAAEDVEFESADGTKLHGFYFPHDAPKAYVLFCHGNGEHVGYIGSDVRWMADYLDAAIFAFDYRGYGKSEGKPYEEGVLQDAVAAQKWLAAKAGIQPSNVVVHGRSLGGGVAVYVASELGADKLILERTFHSMVDIGAGQYPWLPIRWVMRNRYPSVERIRKYDGPLIQMHGTQDSLIPIESGRRLFDSCPSVKKSFMSIEGMGHNGAAPAEFWAAVRELLHAD